MSISELEGQLASLEVIQYALNLAVQHRKSPMDNITGALLDAELEGAPISEDMFGWMFILILVGGNESTRTVIAQGMRLLMEHPDQLQYLVENPDKISNACEEILRYNTAFISMRRTATEDTELGGQQIKKGDKVILHYHAANHDEAVFGEDAMSFDVTRAERMPDLYNQLRSFGIGQHFCIGTHLARLELNIMFEEIIPRLRNPKLKGEPKFVRSFFVNAMKELRIAFDPEVANSRTA
jgi:cytochrome P450